MHYGLLSEHGLEGQGINKKDKKALIDAVNKASSDNNEMILELKAKLADVINSYDPIDAAILKEQKAKDEALLKENKTLIANAITSKGVSASADSTFKDLANKIYSISTGKKVANGTTKVDQDSNYDFTLTISGLDFKPSFIFIKRNGSIYPIVIYWDITSTTQYTMIDSYTKSSSRNMTNQVNASGKYVNSYVNFGGFKLNIFDDAINSNSQMDWIAIE